MKLNVVIHQADEGGYWAEVPPVPGCAIQGDSIEKLLKNVHKAVRGACPSMSKTFRSRKPTGSSRSRCEGHQRKTDLPTSRTSRMAVEEDQRQPSYLHERWNCCPYLGEDHYVI